MSDDKTEPINKKCPECCGRGTIPDHARWLNGEKEKDCPKCGNPKKPSDKTEPMSREEQIKARGIIVDDEPMSREDIENAVRYGASTLGAKAIAQSALAYLDRAEQAEAKSCELALQLEASNVDMNLEREQAETAEARIKELEAEGANGIRWVGIRLHQRKMNEFEHLIEKAEAREISGDKQNNPML